jgi:ankyrin repeat protein
MLLVAIALPYSAWQRVFARKLAESPFANDFMTFNAATGDVATMAVLVAHGVSIDTRSPDGDTSLHIAARLGRLDVIAFLAAHGADPNARDSHGDTSLDVALSARQDQAAQLLVRRFGNRLAPAKPRVNEPIQVTVHPVPSR